MPNNNASHRRGDTTLEIKRKHLQRQPTPNSDPPESKKVNIIQQSSEKSRMPVDDESDESEEEATPDNLKPERPGAFVYNEASAGKRIEITSKYLREAIAKVNKRALAKPATEIFTEQEPFPTLFYHIDDVRKEIAKLNDDEANRDLQHLDFILSDMEPLWNRAREENFESGFASYDMLWKLYQPGELAVHEDELGSLWQFSFIAIRYREGEMNRDGKVETSKYALISAWGLGWDNLEGCLTRRHHVFTLNWFSGQVPITSLLVYPMGYNTSHSIQKLNDLLTKRGQDWWRLVTSRSFCLDYNGIAFHDTKSGLRNEDDSGPNTIPNWNRSKVSERVVIDIKAKALWYLKTSDNDSLARRRTNVPHDHSDEYKSNSLPGKTYLTEEEARLCPANIGCHSLSTMETYIVNVDKLVPVAWDEDAMDHLVLEKRKKDILKGLVGQHYNNRKSESMGDLIKDKGKGLVILLHGPPGVCLPIVGKTLTAECISEAIQRPLISLSIGNLVWEEKKLQQRLKEEFDRATRWDAILLLDEADVVLEARSFEDVRRNGMVSVFLRQLEYYQGVLFLTSNRVSTMDIAFQSRIQIGISFKNMTPAIRSQIWQQLLALNGRDKIIGPQAVEDVKQKLGKFELNGRQIRNVLNVADGLAFNEYGESGKLKYSHIREAVESAVEFQNMLEDARSSMKNEQTVWAMYRGGDD